jgi:hypothetical protein
MNQSQVNTSAAGVVQLPPMNLDAHIDLTNRPSSGQAQSSALPDRDEASTVTGVPGATEETVPSQAADPGAVSDEVGDSAGADQAEQADSVHCGNSDHAAPEGESLAVPVVATSSEPDLPQEDGDERAAETQEPGETAARQEPGAEPSAEVAGVLSEATLGPHEQFEAMLEKEYGLRTHPVCAMFPEMGSKEMQDLTEDVRANGLVHPIVKHDGRIVDGRHRLKACLNAGVEPRFVEWRDLYHGAMPVGRWIWSNNAERRHLTRDQIIATHVLLREWELREDARQRQANQFGNEVRLPGGLPTNSSEVISQVRAPQTSAANAAKNHSGEVRHQLAQETGHSEYGVQQALNVSKADPELLRQVAKGKTKLRDAAKQVKAKAAAAKPPASTRGKRLPAKKGKPEAAIDMDAKVKAAMRSVDEVLDGLAEEHRDRFLCEMVKQLQSMR